MDSLIEMVQHHELNPLFRQMMRGMPSERYSLLMHIISISDSFKRTFALSSPIILYLFVIRCPSVSDALHILFIGSSLAACCHDNANDVT